MINDLEKPQGQEPIAEEKKKLGEPGFTEQMQKDNHNNIGEGGKG